MEALWCFDGCMVPGSGEVGVDLDRLMEVRFRAHSAGLDLDNERLEQLAEALHEFNDMLEVLDRIEVNPTDLALETYDPTWSEGAPRR